MQNMYLSEKHMKSIALLLSLVLIVAWLIGPSLAYIVTGTTSLINTFISGLTPEGDLIIQKTVEHPFGGNYMIPENIEFTFQVELGEVYASKTVDTSKGEQTADANGMITVSVKPGGSVAIRSIVEGTNVTVTEIQNMAGFSVKDGEISRTVTINSKTDITVRFVNTYIPLKADSEKLNVSGVKNLVGRDWQAGDAFTFQLDYRFVGTEDGGWTTLGTETVIYEQDGSADFNQFDFSELVHEVDFDKIGVYAFRVSEVEGSIGGITYDDIISYFDVRIDDADMDGMLEIQDVSGSSNATVSRNEADRTYYVSVEFTNQYAPEGSAEVTIPITKTVTDQSGQNKLPAGFAFELYNADGQLVKTSDVTSAAGETAIKLVFDASEAGNTYTYTLKEVDGGQTKDGMSYDSTCYEFAVSIIDNLDGTVRAVTDAADIVFVNVYDPQDALVNMTGTKELEGRKIKDGEFRFNLYKTGSDFTVDQNDAPVGTAVNDADGNFRFDTISFDRVGTYYYVVREDASAGVGGVIYDEVEYHVTITVTDVNGILKAQCAVTDAFGEAAQLCFRNIYDPEDVSVSLDGRKELQGAELTEGMFSFKLYGANEQFEMKGEAIQTVGNNADGSFRFDDLSYGEVGIYHYIVLEDASEQTEGIVYDSTVYGVTVTVTDDGNGKLTAEKEIVIVGGSSAEEISFVNIDTSEDDPTQPDGPGTPPTGDRGNGGLYALIAGISALALILLLVCGKRRKRKY